MISRKKVDIARRKIKSKCVTCKDKLNAECYNCTQWNNFISQMASAEIPVDYWFRRMKDFYGSENLKESVFEVIENINNVYENGRIYFITGERGRGKTMASCGILKEAILKGYSVLYITLSDLVTKSTTIEPSIKLKIKLVDFLVIDEVDNRFFPTENSMELYGSHLENALRSRMQNKLPTIMCSNALDIGTIFGGQFGESFRSLWSQFVEIIVAGGPDARMNQEKLNES